jgi:ribose transport system substrate-binding protein
MKKLLLLVLVLFIAAGFVFAAGEQEDAKEYDYVIGKIPYTFEHAYHQAVCREITEYSAKMYNTKAVIIDGESSAEATLAAVENLISQGVDGIALHCGDAGLSAKALDMAHAAGVPMVTTLIRPENMIAPHIQPQETPSSIYMGAEAARQWKAAHPNTPIKVAMLNFGGIEQVWDMRTGAFFDGVKSVDPNAELVTMLNGQGSTVKSMEIILDVLQADPDVNLIFAANDEMALGALAACEQLGRGVMDNGIPLTEIIAGLDASSAALVKIFDPNGSFKLTHGAVRDIARAEVDTVMAMINGEIPMDEYMETRVLSPTFDYWNTPLSEAQRHLEQNFFYEGDLEADVKAAMK